MRESLPEILSAKLRRIRWTCSWHRQHLRRETQGVHQTGSIPIPVCWREMDSNFRSPRQRRDPWRRARHGARATFAARPHGSGGRPPTPQTMPSRRKPATAAASRPSHSASTSAVCSPSNGADLTAVGTPSRWCAPATITARVLRSRPKTMLKGVSVARRTLWKPPARR